MEILSLSSWRVFLVPGDLCAAACHFNVLFLRLEKL
jgi:hypothetical protein